jgi:hypothetical protein
MQLIDKEKKNPYDNCEPAHPAQWKMGCKLYLFNVRSFAGKEHPN